MQKLFDRISKELIEKKAKGPYFDNRDYIPKEIDQGNFHKIIESNKRKVAFIDGGNIEIVGNNNFSFQLMRIYWTIYSDKRIKSKKSDYFVFIRCIMVDDSMIYSGEIYSKDNLLETINFDIKNREKPESIINSIRRIFEIRAVKELVNEIDNDDIIVMDGNLAVKNNKEFKEMESVLSLKIQLVGVSKTSSIMTNTGSNLVGYIHSISPEGKWYYYPICENKNIMHKADMVVAKLHEKSEYAFLVDVNTADQINSILFNLSLNAKDPVFLGYPYGLIDADKHARCQEIEADYLKTKFLQNCRNTKKLRQILNTNKAHDILDSIN